ncbi:hypothetical protein E2C01_069953 [Portunus trituberculatus]|uniref:Uncharacterized protein n=1 Tax=Portunus trituberculatus TaxID=210409 RepID=A0A5B7HZZ0_PORTR|nr:hypothetical protein [Portunus trituberculatus]
MPRVQHTEDCFDSSSCHRPQTTHFGATSDLTTCLTTHYHCLRQRESFLLLKKTPLPFTQTADKLSLVSSPVMLLRNKQ